MCKKNHVAWFSGKTFIVTGGSSGIGLAISQQLAEEGAKVIAISYDPEEFPVAQSQLDENQTNIEFVKCDIAIAQDRVSLKNKIMDSKVSIAGLINNAGITTFGPFFETPSEAIKRNLDVNFTGTVMFIRELFPLVLNNEEIETKYLGFMSSTSAKAPMGLIGGYPATKAGMEMILRTLGLELPKKVKILAVRAGPVKTNLYSNSVTAPGFDINVLAKNGERMFLEPEKVASVFVKAIRKKKSGVKHASFGARMMVAMMKGKGLGRLMTKGMIMLNERAKHKNKHI
ncbi:MAG: SDR family NAD(P)-dependent oxidoreductase [Promethearchaeota archaeon]